MVLKQRFADGRTNYIDIGEQWLLVQSNAEDFEIILKRHFKEVPITENCIAFICYGKHEEPIFKYYHQWIYSSDGKLFMNLT